MSNDEVPTPPRIARDMLNLLPLEVWTNPDCKWLDPFSKSGVYLREVAARLLDGLAEWQPDFDKRREHIFRNMIYGAAITTMTGMIARRTLYCSRDATSELSVVKFDNPDGNLPFAQAEHTWTGNTCKVCGGPRSLEREDRENYAYAFIHGAYPTEEMKDMKFDVIVGNPPYQIDSDGSTRTKAVYHLFVERAIAMDPKHVLMITPSRWFAGGLGLDSFRARMLADEQIAQIVDYPLSKDCFPGVKIRGGVSYFLWTKGHTGGCTIRTGRGSSIGPPMIRNLDAYDVFVRFNEGVGIVEKVRARNEPTMDNRVSSRVPFGIPGRKFSDYVPPDTPGAITLHIIGRKVQWIRPERVTTSPDLVPKYKTLLHAAYGEDHDGPYSVIANPFVAGPNSACTDTYLLIGAFDTDAEAQNLAAFLRTRFARFLIWLRMNTQHVRKDLFSFVPDLDWTRPWTDADLYARYGLTEDEIEVIECQVREMKTPGDGAPVEDPGENVTQDDE
ncbi:Eco57I restriction-modification methylase domain-containing protein [Mycobacterium colombiense]|uniref:Eco57I restriction-modification methylase domain-containing protein n=1 Tax=Mycobacterium colombiense TaxID=339268 RepID=UPI0004BA5D26|nr:Eco57I restriction-modification methylase domain-containing protein [Mycobacterium colombiense]